MLYLVCGLVGLTTLSVIVNIVSGTSGANRLFAAIYGTTLIWVLTSYAMLLAR